FAATEDNIVNASPGSTPSALTFSPAPGSGQPPFVPLPLGPAELEYGTMDHKQPGVSATNQLEGLLRRAGITEDDLARAVGELRGEAERKDHTIAELRTRVAALEQRLAERTTALETT